MSYAHSFYGLDIDRLKSIYGSKDEAFVTEILEAQAEAFEANDEFFETEIEDGQCPNSETALREIIEGQFGEYEYAEAMYGYVLKIICEQIGEFICPDDVAAVRDHPYDSQLVASGPPIPIPYDPTDGPQIGFLSLSDIPAEIQRIDSAPKRAKRSALRILLYLLRNDRVGKQMVDEAIAEDMSAYRATLQEAAGKELSIVSFRH